MSDRHVQLPARPSLEYYRKQAKHLHRAHAAGDTQAEARVADVLGSRATERFLLTDAQFVLAQEHGFLGWAEFRTHIDSRSTTRDRPVSRLDGIGGPGIYASMADTLLAELRRNDPAARRRLRAYVPRHATATSATGVKVGDARLVIARELGFPTWPDLVSFAETTVRDLDQRRDNWRGLHGEAEALLAGDTDRLAGLTAEQANTLLHMLAAPEAIPGARLTEELGVPRTAVDVLLSKATDLDLPLMWAVRSNRVEYVRLLLDAGADPGTRRWGPTPLETAIFHGHTAVVDILAEPGIIPPALWTYAACGRLDLVQACFDTNGKLRPDAASPRPNPAHAYGGLLPRLPATDDPQEIVAEAFVHACQHGRIDIVRWLLDHGVHPDVSPYYGRTGLHWAIPPGHLELIRLLLDHGADPTIRDDLFHADADGWLHIFFATRPHHPLTQQLHDLIETRSR